MKGILLVSHDYHSMTAVIQNMGGISLLLAINVLFQNKVTMNQIVRLILVQLRELISYFEEKQRKWRR
jgi:hypothetical protein